MDAAFDRKQGKRVGREAAAALGGERFFPVLMPDGAMLRARGDDWGLKPASKPGARVAWHELKVGLVIRMPESPAGHRRGSAKYYVASVGAPEAIGRQSLLDRLLGASPVSWDASQCATLRREAAYFRSHADHLDYPESTRAGLPLGSGSMESGCSQLQCRFKRPGQFWGPAGERNLLALELTWRNGDWPALWAKAG